MKKATKQLLLVLAALPVTAATGLAQEAAEAAAPAIDSGDTAWMIVASVLVLLMTIPGLSLFYGGLVRTKNILSVLVQCFAIFPCRPRPALICRLLPSSSTLLWLVAPAPRARKGRQLLWPIW